MGTMRVRRPVAYHHTECPAPRAIWRTAVETVETIHINIYYTSHRLASCWCSSPAASRSYLWAVLYSCICQRTAVSPPPSIPRTVSITSWKSAASVAPLISVSLTDGYELGGLGTSVKRDSVDGGGLSCRGKSYKENHCLYPGDLYPFTRRPMFIIIDSDNSFVFQHIPRYFGQPLVILMSPQDVPPAFQGRPREGFMEFQSIQYLIFIATSLSFS